MPRQELNSLIGKLRQELAHLQQDQQGSRDQIQSLIDDLEVHLQSGKSNDWPHEMTQRVRKEIEDFETEHPRITGVLNNIMVTLGNIGI